MRINELKALKSNLLQVIQKYEGKGIVLPSCITDLKNFLRLVEMPDFETVIGDDPDTPCWKYVSDGGLDQYPDLKDAFEEFTAELKGFRS